MIGLGTLPGNSTSTAYGVSADGSLIVGACDSLATSHAFRWRPETGMVSLGSLLGHSFFSSAHAVSPDGDVIVGTSVGSFGFGGLEAVRWTSDGVLGLGDLEGGNYHSVAYGVSAHGSVVVGQGTTSQGQEAFIWTPTSGMLRLQDHLADTYNLSLPGWKLVNATGITPDGKHIVGWGHRNGISEAWLITIPEPSSALGIALVLACKRFRRPRSTRRDRLRKNGCHAFYRRPHRWGQRPD